MDLFQSFEQNNDDPYLFNNQISPPFLNDTKYYDLPPFLSEQNEYFNTLPGVKSG